MSLARGEQRTLAEIENHLRRSDPRLAAMFSLLTVRGVRPVMWPAAAEAPGWLGRARLIILAAAGVALIIVCIAMAVHPASHAATPYTGNSSGVSSTSVYGRLPVSTSGHAQGG